MGLYDAVRKEKSRRRFHPLWAAALVFAVALVTVLGLVISKPQRDHDRFVQCMSEISSSTAYALARKHTNLQAQVDGQSLRITQENGYALYGKLFNMGAVFSRDVPKDGGIRLDRLPAGSARSQGLFVRFRNPEGKVYSYYTDRDTFARVTECLSPEHNPAWD